MQSPVPYERFEAYGFGIDYPADCTIEFNPRSTRTVGDVAMKSPRGYKLFLSWGDLQKVKKLNGIEGHADYTIQRLKGRLAAQVGEVRKESTTVNGHRASFRDVTLEVISKGFFPLSTSKSLQRVRSLHVHCDVSSRYFVIYSQVSPEKSEEQIEVVSNMVKTFVCHRR